MTAVKHLAVKGRRATKKPYLYRASGLDDIYLVNGFSPKQTAYGPGVEIEDVLGLHRAIGYRLVAENTPLTGPEFRFLRKQMDLTQEALAQRLRVDVQTVARYEKGQTAIPGAADLVLRMMFALDVAPKGSRETILRSVEALLTDAHPARKRRARRFERTPEGWNAGTLAQ